MHNTGDVGAELLPASRPRRFLRSWLWLAIVEDPDSGLPADAVATLKMLVAALSHPETEIGLCALIAPRLCPGKKTVSMDKGLNFREHRC